MSYCRWSSMNHRCALYAYDDEWGGITIHVASAKRDMPDDFPENPIKEFLKGNLTSEEAAQAMKEWHDKMQELPIKDIGLPYDGQTFRVAGPDEAVETISMLRMAGYTMPDGLEEMIRQNKEGGR